MHSTQEKKDFEKADQMIRQIGNEHL